MDDVAYNLTSGAMERVGVMERVIKGLSYLSMYTFQQRSVESLNSAQGNTKVEN